MNVKRCCFPAALGLAWCVLGLLGCASVDPSGDYREVEGLVSSRLADTVAVSAERLDPESLWRGDAPLSQDVAVRQALLTSPELRLALADIASARAAAEGARLWPDPVLSAAFGFPTDGLSGEPHMAALAQQLAWLWQRGPRIAARDAELSSRIASAGDLALDIAARVRIAFAKAKFADRAVEAGTGLRDAIEVLAEFIRREQAAGVATRDAVLEIEGELWRAREQLVQLRTAAAVARRELLVAVDQAEAPDSFLLANDVEEPEAIVEEAVLASFALRTHLRLAAARSLAQSWEESLRGTRRESWGDIAIGVGHQRNFSTRRGVFPQVEVRPRLFGSGAVLEAQAEAASRKAWEQWELVRRDVLREVRVAWLRYSEELQLRDLIRDGAFALARERRQNAERELSQGVGSRRTLLRRAAAESRAALRLIRAQQQLAVRKHELERASGGVLKQSTKASSASSMSARRGA